MKTITLDKFIEKGTSCVPNGGRPRTVTGLFAEIIGNKVKPTKKFNDTGTEKQALWRYLVAKCVTRRHRSYIHDI